MFCVETGSVIADGEAFAVGGHGLRWAGQDADCAGVVVEGAVGGLGEGCRTDAEGVAWGDGQVFVLDR